VTKESQALLASLTAQRNHVIGALEGLAEEDLQRPVLPSQWTCAGLVHHPDRRGRAVLVPCELLDGRQWAVVTR
jgi:hypothetical protein